MVWKIGFLAFLTGFFSLCVQVVATQFAFFSQPQSSHAIGLSLCAFLLGLGIAARLTHNRQEYLQKHFRAVVALSFGLVGVFFFFLSIHTKDIWMLLKSWIPVIAADPSYHYLLTVFLQSVAFLLIPALGLGLLFPLINDRIALLKGTQTGAITSIDYFGAGVGSLFCAFILVPHLGMLLAGAVVSILLIVIALFLAPGWKWRGAGFLFLLLFVGAEFPRIVPVLKLTPILSAHLMFEEPSPFGLVRVSADSHGQSSLFINGRAMCYSNGSRSERLLASGPLRDLASSEAAVLNVGLGCGFTAHQFKHHPKVKELDVVEINPVVVKANYHFRLNLESETGAETRIHISDGYAYLEKNPKTYDVVAVDVEEPSIIHSSSLFTADFFKVVKSRLNPKGVFTLWTFNQPETGRIILNTLRSVFAHADVVVSDGHLVFFAADQEIKTAKLHGDKRSRQAILDLKLNEVATIAKNPYAKYFKVNEIFSFEPGHVDAFEMKATH